MALQITADLAALGTAQRKALAEFIMSFPGACSGSGTCHTGDPIKAPPAVDVVVTAGSGSAILPPELAAAVKEVAEKSARELAQLAADATQPGGPEQAFGSPAGNLDAAAVFGAPVGNVPGGTTPASTPATNAPGAGIATSTPTTGSVSLAAVVPPAGSADLDSSGLPWDGRIHASTKSKVEGGTWKKKRGVSPEQLASVEAQLRAVMAGAPGGNAPTAVATATTPPPAVPASASSGTGTASATVVPPPPPAASPAPVPPAGEDPKVLFAALVKTCTEAAAAGKISSQEITDACQRHGGPGLVLPLLVNRLDLVPAISTEINALLLSR